MPYIGNSPGTGTRNRFIFTATASQTTFSGADDNGKTLAYSDGDYVDVYLNGICLVPVDDYAATSKTSIVLTVGAAASDTLEVVAYDIATIADTVSKANGGNFEAGINIDGNVGIGTTSPSAGLHVLADVNPIMKLDRGSANSTNANLYYNGTFTGQISAANADFQISAAGASTPMSFYTDGSERMRIDSSGNVIATSGSLNLVGTNTQMFASSNGDDIQFKFSGVKKAALNNGGLFSAGDGNSLVPGFRFTDDANTGMFRPSADTLAFSTASVERMRVTSSGHVYIATTSALNSSSASGIEIRSNSVRIGSSASTDNLVLSTGTTGTKYFLSAYQNGSLVGSITGNGSSLSFNTSSDYRLKENVTDVTDGITRVKQLAPKRFNFIGNDTTVDGFIAHETQTVVPEAVRGEKDAMRDEEYEVTAALGEVYTPAASATYDDDGNELTAATDEVIHSTDVSKPETLADGQLWRETTAAVMGTRSVPDYQGIDQAKLVPLLTAALQEAIAKIETLETEMTSVKSRLDALEAN